MEAAAEQKKNPCAAFLPLWGDVVADDVSRLYAVVCYLCTKTDAPYAVGVTFFSSTHFVGVPQSVELESRGTLPLWECVALVGVRPYKGR